MGDYEDVLASLETLNHSVLKAMGYTKKVSGCGQCSQETRACVPVDSRLC